MLNLAGVDLVLPRMDDEATKFIERYISSDSFQYYIWSRPTRPGPLSTGLTFPWPRREVPLKINTLYWPSGATRWGFGHFLCSSDQLNSVMNNAYNTDGSSCVISLLIGTPDIGDQVGQQGSTDNQIDVQVSLLTATPLSGIRGLSQMNTGTQSLYLITVVDQRWWWYNASTGDLEIDSSFTWDNLYAALAGQIGLDPNNTFTWDTINSKYLQPSPSMFTLSYQPVPFALDAVAFNVGQRISCAFDGTVAAHNQPVDYANLTADFNANQMTRLIVAGGPRWSPAEFPAWNLGTSTSPFPKNTTLSLLNIGAIQVFFGQSCGGSGGYLSTCTSQDAIGGGGSIPPPPGGPCTTYPLVFTDTALPCPSPGESGDPENKQTLDDLACQFAGDFLSWIECQFDYVLAGIVNVMPVGLYDQIEFAYTGDIASTRIYSGNLNGWPTELGHDDPDCPGSVQGGTLMYGISTTDIPAGSVTGMVQLYKSDKVTTIGNPVKVDNSGGWWNTDIPINTNVIVGRINCVIQIIAAKC